MAFETLILTREERWAVITLNRPPANAINEALVRELNDALASVEEDADVRAVIVTGAGERIFCAGADLGSAFAGANLDAFIRFGNAVMRRIERFPKPVIAALNGHALGGGCELALACDLVVASDAATFAQPEIKLGVIAPYACIRLPRLIGPKQAAELLLTGATIPAAEAAQLGLVNRIVPAAEFSAAVEQLIGQLAALSGAALALCKRAMRFADLPFSEALAAVERLYLEDLMATADAHEGLTAFLEKRKPVWRNA